AAVNSDLRSSHAVAEKYGRRGNPPTRWQTSSLAGRLQLEAERLLTVVAFASSMRWKLSRPGVAPASPTSASPYENFLRPVLVLGCPRRGRFRTITEADLWRRRADLRTRRSAQGLAAEYYNRIRHD